MLLIFGGITITVTDRHLNAVFRLTRLTWLQIKEQRNRYWFPRPTSSHLYQRPVVPSKDRVPRDIISVSTALNDWSQNLQFFHFYFYSTLLVPYFMYPSQILLRFSCIITCLLFSILTCKHKSTLLTFSSFLKPTRKREK